MAPEEDEDDDLGQRTTLINRVAQGAATPEPDPIAHYLVVVEGTAPGKRLELDAVAITIGRAASQTLFCDDPDVSRQHARIALANGVVTVEDLRSTNGTFVDETRIAGAVTLQEGARIRLGGQLLRYERRSRADVKKQQELDRDIQKANSYVMSLLPAPMATDAVHSEWCFVPSAQLGGDAFGYYWLDDSTFVFYLCDVSGHGVGSAMHSVSVLNVLRQRALPQVDFTDPSQVLASLNDRFPMHEHNGLYFTMWYGVYKTDTRVLTYGTAGHGPALLVPADKSKTEHLGLSAMMIGMLPDQTYQVASVVVPPGSTVYVFSDGAYEIVTKAGELWGLENFEPLVLLPSVPGLTEPARVYQAIKHVAKAGSLDDDFSLLALTFP